jgi:hypothetical protein
MELISVRPAPHHGPPMPRKSRPRLRSVTKSKAKNFIRCPSPSREEAGASEPFKNPDEAKRFYAAVQGELSPGTEVRSIKRSFPGAALGLEKERKRERSGMAHGAV